MTAREPGTLGRRSQRGRGAFVFKNGPHMTLTLDLTGRYGLRGLVVRFFMQPTWAQWNPMWFEPGAHRREPRKEICAAQP